MSDAWAVLEKMAADDRTQAHLLSDSLAVAVPLWIERYRGATWEDAHRRAQECMQVVAEKGDIILYRSKRQGETAEAFNRLAEGLAILASQPGGVTFAGQHWEAPPLRATTDRP